MILDPGPWQSFIHREDNKNLTINELKVKFMQEQLLYENYISFLMQENYTQQQQLMNMQSNANALAAAGGAGGGDPFGEEPDTGTDPSSNSYVVDGYIDNYFV